jgi:hypothetical protein
MKKLLKSKKARLAAVLTAVAGSSFAVQAEDYTTQIGTAVTDGSGNLTAVIAGVITIAIIGFGVAAMLKWMK